MSHSVCGRGVCILPPSAFRHSTQRALRRYSSHSGVCAGYCFSVGTACLPALCGGTGVALGHDHFRSTNATGHDRRALFRSAGYQIAIAPTKPTCIKEISGLLIASIIACRSAREIHENQDSIYLFRHRRRWPGTRVLRWRIISPVVMRGQINLMNCTPHLAIINT